MTIVLSVPQWQGSAVPTAPRLVSGARRAADLVPADSVVTVPTGDGAVDIVDGVRALHTLVGNQRQIGAALAQLDDFVLIIGGECSVDVLPIAAIAERYGDALTVLWIDAHPDVYGPGQLKTGAFHAMGVRTLLGDGPPALTPSWTLAPGQVILAGERAGGASEHEYIRKTGLRRYGVVDLEEAFAAVIGGVCPRRSGRARSHRVRLRRLSRTGWCPLAAACRPDQRIGQRGRSSHHRVRASRRRPFGACGDPQAGSGDDAWPGLAGGDLVVGVASRDGLGWGGIGPVSLALAVLIAAFVAYMTLAAGRSDELNVACKDAA